MIVHSLCAFFNYLIITFISACLACTVFCIIFLGIIALFLTEQSFTLFWKNSDMISKAVNSCLHLLHWDNKSRVIFWYRFFRFLPLSCWVLLQIFQLLPISFLSLCCGVMPHIFPPLPFNFLLLCWWFLVQSHYAPAHLFSSPLPWISGCLWRRMCIGRGRCTRKHSLMRILCWGFYPWLWWLSALRSL